MRRASIHPGPWIGPVMKLCAAKKQRTMKHLECLTPGSPLVVTSALTSADVSLTSGTRSPDETDGAAGSVTHSIFVRFTSNFVHLHPLPPLKKGSCHGSHSLIFFKFQLGNLRKSLTGREMQRKQGSEEAEMQKLHTTAPEHLTDDKLLLSTLCAEGLARKHSVVGTMIARVSHQKPLAIYQDCQSARVLTSGRHGAPQVCGHSIRNQGNHGVPPVEHKKHLQEPLCAPGVGGWKGRNHKHMISSGR
jgi:hypothetical protein